MNRAARPHSFAALLLVPLASCWGDGAFVSGWSEVGGEAVLDPNVLATLTLSLELSNLDVHRLDAYAHHFDVAVYAPNDAGVELILLDADDDVLAEGWHGPGAWWVGSAPTCDDSSRESTYRVVMATNADIRVPVDWVAGARSTLPLGTFGGSRPAPEVVLTWTEDP